MPILAAKECYKKWITTPQVLREILELEEHNRNNVAQGDRALPFTPPQRDFGRMVRAKLVTDKLRANVNGAGDEIQAVLKNADRTAQFERDVAMWYGYCKDNSKGAQLCLRLFSLLQQVGVLYKESNGAWGDFSTDFPNMPVASLLSHGGRILFLLPRSSSACKTVGGTIGAFLKGITVDPIKATFGRGTYHTMRGKSTKLAVASHAALRLTGLAAAGAILSTPHKMMAAGDDRIFDFLSGGDLHSRALATHSTIYCERAEQLGYGRQLWFTEENAKGGFHHISNLRDGMMGRHFYKNLALGGVGNVNPFSGVTIDKEGGHGHLYVNYRAPQHSRHGCMLVGAEGSAPGFSDQTGKVHDASGTKGLWSPTGGQKWNELDPNTFFKTEKNKNDVTQFVCDLSDLQIWEIMGIIQTRMLSADQLHSTICPVKPVKQAPQITVVTFAGRRQVP